MMYFSVILNYIGIVLLVVGSIYGPIALSILGRNMIYKLKNKIKSR